MLREGQDGTEAAGNLLRLPALVAQARAAGVRLDADLPAEPVLADWQSRWPATARLAVLRVVQEGLSNVIQHGGDTIDGPALYNHLTARDNLRVHTHLTGVPESRIDEVLPVAGLHTHPRLARTKVKAFSPGMKARLALAIALLTDPEVLVLDGPQNGLDPEGIIELRGLIRDLAGQGRAVLISSHQLGEVTRLADNIGILAAVAAWSTRGPSTSSRPTTSRRPTSRPPRRWRDDPQA